MHSTKLVLNLVLGTSHTGTGSTTCTRRSYLEFIFYLKVLKFSTGRYMSSIVQYWYQYSRTSYGCTKFGLTLLRVEYR
jgi:hypothetical protein